MDFPGQTRRVISFKRMALTDFVVEIPRLAKKSVLKKAIDEAGELNMLCVLGCGAEGWLVVLRFVVCAVHGSTKAASLVACGS